MKLSVLAYPVYQISIVWSGMLEKVIKRLFWFGVEFDRGFDGKMQMVVLVEYMSDFSESSSVRSYFGPKIFLYKGTDQLKRMLFKRILQL